MDNKKCGKINRLPKTRKGVLQKIIFYSRIFGLAPIKIIKKQKKFIYESNVSLKFYSLVFMAAILGAQVYLLNTMGNIIDFVTGAFAVFLDIITCISTTIAAFTTVIILYIVKEYVPL